MHKLSIIIPVFNEVGTLERILEAIESVPLPIEREIILVDDYSTDGSRDVIKKLSNRYITVLLTKNQGKGAAIQAGLKTASGDYVLIQDADLEYDPKDIIKLIREVTGNGATVVYGSRNLIKNPRFKQSYYYGGKLVTAITNTLFGTKLTDVNTCYKLYPTDFLRSLNLKEKKFSFCEEATAKTLRRGMTIKEVPISYTPRTIMEGKKLRVIDGVRAIITVVKNRYSEQ